MFKRVAVYSNRQLRVHSENFILFQSRLIEYIYFDSFKYYVINAGIFAPYCDATADDVQSRYVIGVNSLLDSNYPNLLNYTKLGRGE